MSDLETRIVKLELISDNHDQDIKELKETTSTLKTMLHSIEKNLNQIKYIAVGALSMIVAQSMGIDKALKFILGA
jgi:5-bromo-4-chloroindolyl phosphate hydrolysis protein